MAVERPVVGDCLTHHLSLPAGALLRVASVGSNPQTREEIRMTTSNTGTKKTGASQVVSLDSLAKQRRDALPQPTTFELLGVEFTLPPMKGLPFELQEKAGGNLDDVVGVLKAILGEQKIKEMYAAGFTFGDLELIGEEWQQRSGVEPGESPASPAS